MIATARLLTVMSVLLTATSLVDASEPGRPRLDGLLRLGAIVITAANDTVDEGVLRRLVERRLERAGIAVDGSTDSQLVVNVSAERARAEVGHCACGTFRVALALRESVTLERDPGRAVSAITWNTSGGIRRFTLTAPPQAIADILEEQMSSFLAAIASDTQRARQRSEQP